MGAVPLGRGGASPTVPATVRTLLSRGSPVPCVLCLLVPLPGPARGSEASERRRERGGRCRRVSLSANYELGGERPLLGGRKQASLAEFCTFPSRQPRTHSLVFAGAAHAPLPGYILFEKCRGRCHICPILADECRISSVQLRVLDSKNLSRRQPILLHTERVFVAVGVLVNSYTRIVIRAKR